MAFGSRSQLIVKERPVLKIFLCGQPVWLANSALLEAIGLPV
jgi:hypothetical protein